MQFEAIALCRVSTAKQKAEGSSLAAQEQRVYSAGEYLEASIVKMWSLDVSSRKGKNVKRKDLLEMLAYAKRHPRVKFIIVDEADRFMRGFEEFYYWKVLFREEAGARLVYAAKPHLAFKDDMYSLFEEMIDVFKAEASNQERITKVTEKMQARVLAGYFPFSPVQGYRLTDMPGLHEPDPAGFPLIQKAFYEVLSREYTPEQALRRLLDGGYRTATGMKLSLDKFKRMLGNPYYAGAVRIKGWPANDHALHTPMISLDEHEELQGIVEGRQKKFVRKKHNPEFPLSKTPCTDCQDEPEGRLVGFVHTNGKGWAREEYRCRRCHKYNSRQKVHAVLSEHLAAIALASEETQAFTAAFETVWRGRQQDSVARIKVLQGHLAQLRDTKNKLVEQLVASTGALQDDIKESVEIKRKEIAGVEKEIADARNIQQDLVAFVGFALSYVASLQDRWWSLSHEERLECKELLFPAGFSISPEPKVHTPEISQFFRYAGTQKGAETPSMSDLVDQVGENLHSIVAEADRWRTIIGEKFENK